MKKIKNKYPRVTLYLLLFILLIGVFLYWTKFNSSFSEGLLVATIQIIVTVVIIDGLLSLDRERRLRAVNSHHSASMTYMLGAITVSLVKDFGYVVKPDDMTVIGMQNNDLRKFAENFFDSENYKDYLQRLREASEDSLLAAKKLEKRLDLAFTSIASSLKEVNPYPDPLLTKMLSDAQTTMVVTFRVIDLMQEIVNDVLPDHIKKRPEDGTNNATRDLMEEEFKRLISENDGSDDRANFDNMFKSTIDVMLKIHERAENNKLHYDV